MIDNTSYQAKLSKMGKQKVPTSQMLTSYNLLAGCYFIDSFLQGVLSLEERGLRFFLQHPAHLEAQLPRTKLAEFS